MNMAINVYYVISIAETASKKIEALIRSMKFFLLRLLCVYKSMELLDKLPI